MTCPPHSITFFPSIASAGQTVSTGFPGWNKPNSRTCEPNFSTLHAQSTDLAHGPTGHAKL